MSLFYKNLMRVLFFLCFSAAKLSGQQLDPGYHVKVFGTSYHEIASDAEGNVFVFGSFHDYNGQNLGRIVKIGPDGNPMPFATLYADSPVTKIKILASGKILISGQFTRINNMPVNKLLRLHQDGTIDDTFLSVLQEVSNFDVQSDGKIIVASGRKFYRLLPDGSLDQSFSSDVDLFTSIKMCIGLDDKIYFSMFGNVYKLNSSGASDPTFKKGATKDLSDIWLMHTQADGKILIGGDFTHYNDYASRSIVRINTNGEIDPSFQAAGANSSITTVLERPDHHLVVAGNFNMYGPVASNLVELNSDGSLFRSISVLTINLVSSIVESHEGKLTIAGEFHSVMDNDRYGIARFNADYSLDQSFIPAITLNNQNRHSLQVQEDASLFIGGSHGFFGVFDGIDPVISRIANIHTNGRVNTAFVPFFTSANNKGMIHDHLIMPDNKVVATGLFGDGWQVIRVNDDGTKDEAFEDGIPSHLPGTIVKYGDELLLGGPFSAYNGIATNGLVAITTDGVFLRAYNALPQNSMVTQIAFQSDGKLILLGHFPFASDTKNVIRLKTDGEVDNTFNAILPNGNYADLAVDSLNSIYVSGTLINPVTARVHGIAKFDANGTLDDSFQPWRGSSGFVHILSIEILPDNKIAIGGLFDEMLGYQSPGIAILDTNGKYIFTPEPVFGKQTVVSDMVFQNDQLFVAGILVRNDYREVYGIQKILLNDITAPQAPTDLGVVANGGVALISWSDNANNELAFVLERSTSEGTGFVPVDTIPFNTYETQTPLESNADNVFRLRAINYAGSSEYSNTASVGWYPVPEGELSVSVSQLGETTVLVQWEGSILYHDGYIVQRKIEDSEFVTIDTLAADAVSFTDEIEEDQAVVYLIMPYNVRGTISFESTIFQLSPVMAVAGLAEENVRLYPVPTQRYVKLDFPQGSVPSGFAVKSREGRAVIVPMELSGRGVTLDLGELPPGVYFLQYYHAAGVCHSRLLKY